MLHSFGIRTKLLALLALPIVALIAISGFTSVQAFGQASQARQIEQLASGSGALARLVSALQVERSLSIASIQKSPVASELKRARANTDDSLKATDGIRSALEGASLNPKAQAALLRSVLGHDQLADLRETVSGGFAKEELVADQYAAIIANDITLPQRVADSLDSPAIRAQLTAYALSQELVELATQERDAGVAVIAERRASPQTAATLARVAALRLQTETDLRVNSTDEQIAVLDEVLSSPVLERAAYRDMQQALVAAGTTGAVDLDVSQWRNAANARLDALGTLAQPTAASAAEIAADEASSQRSRAFLVLALTALVVLVLVLAGLVLSRAITRPLRHLTDVAGRVRDELPLMVERMSAPGDGPGVELPEIPVGSQDEVGQLARAFKDVNDTTIRVAEEQAALRASIAEMFVNVARRNHILLSRQLSFIDQLERTEENPDTLDSLFRLDHLATRMRRNAESLIVLAGIDAGRRLRRPMPLSDVIRTAVSEIERYDRVDLALQADPPVVGHVALTTAHLLAELLENATQFSNPDTRVVTSTAFAGDGVRITITDLGLGMTGAEIDDANTRIANPPMRDVVGSSRLGFYVVGRLARRLDATVELKAGRAQGTVVTVDLPPSLFTAGSVVDFSGISDTGAITPALPAAPDAEVSAPAPGLPAAPATGGGLPRRGQHQAEPVPSVEPVTAQDAPEPAQESPSRSRVFSGFRSRREPGDAVGSSVVPPSLPASGLPVVADSPTTFVPAVVADELLPQLPQRGQATAPALAAPALAAPAPVPAPVPAPADHAPQWALALDAPVAAPVVVPAVAPAAAPAAEPAALPEWARAVAAAAPAFAEAAQAAPAAPSYAAPSRDILPARSPGRSLRRRPGKRVEAEPQVWGLPAPAPAAAPVAGPPSGSPFDEPAGPPAGLVPDDVPAFAADASNGAAPSAQAAPAVPAVPALAAAQSLRERSAMASEALSELSALSTYRPQAVQTSAGLARRTPQATPAGQLPAPELPPPPSRPGRNAADVRSMLSGFQAGVQRGRGAPAGDTADTGDLTAEGQPAADGRP